MWESPGSSEKRYVLPLWSHAIEPSLRTEFLCVRAPIVLVPVQDAKSRLETGPTTDVNGFFAGDTATTGKNAIREIGAVAHVGGSEETKTLRISKTTEVLDVNLLSSSTHCRYLSDFRRSKVIG